MSCGCVTRTARVDTMLAVFPTPRRSSRCRASSKARGLPQQVGRRLGGYRATTSWTRSATSRSLRQRQDDRRRARRALFGAGEVGNLGSLPLRYGTQGRSDRRFMRDIRPTTDYDVWGDASLLEFGARSRSGLYAQFDRGKSFAMFGDLSTPRSKRSNWARFDRSVNGAMGRVEAGALEFSGFASRGTSHQQIDGSPAWASPGPLRLSRARTPR